MVGEVVAFSDMVDVVVSLSEKLATFLSKTVPVQLFTDRKSLFDVISNFFRTSEKRMMLYIAAAKEGFRDRVISNIGFVRT